MTADLSKMREKLNILKEQNPVTSPVYNEYLDKLLPAIIIPNSQKEDKGNIKIDKRKFNKRHPNSGRKPTPEKLLERGIKQWVDDHINSDATINVKDPQTGVEQRIKKPRISWVLERLWEIGMRDNDIHALDMWLNRALGRPAQVIKGDEEEPIMIKVDF